MRRIREERLTQWTKSKLDAIYQLALLGATEDQMATAFGVSVWTIKKWKQNHVEVRKAVDDGTLGLCSKVARALAQRALGYTFDEEIATYDKTSHSWVKTTKKTHIAADPWAASRILELKGRNFNWSTTQNIQINTFNNNVDIKILGDLTEEQLKLLREISQKQLPEDAGTSNV